MIVNFLSIRRVQIVEQNEDKIIDKMQIKLNDLKYEMIIINFHGTENKIRDN